MRFGEPQWLWLLLLLPVLAGLVIWAARRRERDLARWCHPSLWGRLIPDRDRFGLWWRGALILLAVFSLVLMAARPQLGSRILSVKRKGIDVMVALDTSESMLAEDLSPNRITRARQAVQSLIDRLRGDRVGLIAFAGEAFVECPLTLDYSAARMFLRFMDTDLIPVPGTAIAEAIRAADRSFDPKEKKFKALVLITDGEDHEGSVEAAAREAREHGVRIFAVGVGTSKGEPIPERGSSGGVRDYKRDRQGNVVLTRLDPSALRRICEDTGGRYYDAGSGNLALDRLYADISGMEQKEMKGGIITQYEDRYGYFAGAALFFLLLEFVLGDRRGKRRRGRTRLPADRVPARREPAAARNAVRTVSLLLPLALPLLLAGPARGADAGGRHYRKGEYPAARDAYEKYAREHPEDPRGAYNLGTTLHQTGEMAPAEQTLRQALRSKDPKLREAAFYNLGNTCARANDLKGARDAYRMALRLQPKDLDAKHNLELVENLLRQQPPDSSQQKQQNQQKADKNQKKDQKNDQKSGKDQDKDQQKDQQSQKDEQQQQQQQQAQNQQSQQDQNPQQQEQQNEQDQQQGQQAGRQGDQDRDKDAQGRPLAPGKMSPEQARQILDGLAQQEMLLQAERLKAKSRDLRVEKDW